MAKTKIEWADETWNPIVGCSKISEGCENCYAEKMAVRMAGMGKPAYWRVTGELAAMVFGGSEELRKKAESLKGKKGWNGKTTLVESALNQRFPGEGKRIFVGSMGDMFHESVFFTDLDKVIQIIRNNPQHTFLFLTKRPEKMRLYFNYLAWPTEPIPNLWLGVTVENQRQADLRIPQLLQIPAAKRFISVEPMFGPVNLCETHAMGSSPLSFALVPRFYKYIDHLDWVICGGENGAGARAMHPEWAKTLQKQCKTAKVPFFFKGWGEWAPNCLCKKQCKTVPRPYPGALGAMFKCGKKKSGNLLDGKEYLEVPSE